VKRVGNGYILEFSVKRLEDRSWSVGRIVADEKRRRKLLASGGIQNVKAAWFGA